MRNLEDMFTSRLLAVGLSLMAGVTWAGCMEPGAPELPSEPSSLNGDDLDAKAPAFSDFRTCTARFPDESPIRCDRGLSASSGSDAEFSQAVCVWSKPLGSKGDFLLLRSKQSEYGLRYDWRPLEDERRIVGLIGVETEDGWIGRVVSLSLGSGFVNIGKLSGDQRAFQVAVFEVGFDLSVEGQNYSLGKSSHHIEQFLHNGHHFMVWNLVVAGHSHFFQHTFAHGSGDGVVYEPGWRGWNGLDFDLVLHGQRFFVGSGSYDAQRSLVGAEQASPLC